MLDVHGAVDLHELQGELSVSAFLAAFFFFAQLALEFTLLPFELCVSELDVFTVVFQELFFVLQQCRLLFVKQGNLGVPLRCHFLFLEGQGLRGLPILLNLLLSDFLPLLQELDVVLLRLLLDEFVVLVHLPHQSHVPFVHLLHVFLDLDDVLLGKLDGH